MLVGIISDTHGKLPIKAEAAMAECDHIIHAGDICGPEILELLRQHAPVTAVLGNNDYDEYGPDVKRWATPEIDGVRFLVAHYPRDIKPGPSGNGGLAPGDPLPQVSIHGHTHVSEIAIGNGALPAKLMMCPGSCTRPRRGPASVGKILIENGQVVRAWIEGIDDSREIISWENTVNWQL